MWILGCNTTHDASICLMKDNEIILHLQEERLTHNKHDIELVHAIDLIKNYTNIIDLGVYSHLYNDNLYFTPYEKLLKKNGIEVKEWIDASANHHDLHAYCAFYNSGFSDAACLIVDGAGSDTKYGKENESIYVFETKKDIRCIYKTLVGHNKETIDNSECNFIIKNKRIGAGMAYSSISQYMGWGDHGCGKVMGLSPYGKFNPILKNLISSTGANENLFKLYNYNRIVYAGTVFSPCEYLSKFHSEEDRDEKVKDLCFKIQKDFERYIFNLIDKTIKLTGKHNIVLSGGCALNCVANYKFRKKLSKEVNLYVDPTCGDDGISIGAAKFGYISQCKKNNITPKDISLKTLYHGQKIEYNYKLNLNEKEIITSPSDVAKLLLNGNVVSICQGKSESGPRALGNRSILFDPRNTNGKEIVNKVKKREEWRPFAGTVLWEYAEDWFDMDRLEESSYMMYAVDVLEQKRSLIPAITHVDGTCRIQTLKREQNPNYYSLIEEFYKLTDVPILFNTSFNLAGDTIVETIDDALKTLRESEIEYMYLPEIKKLIYVPNEKSIC